MKSIRFFTLVATVGSAIALTGSPALQQRAAHARATEAFRSEGQPALDLHDRPASNGASARNLVSTYTYCDWLA
jgi:hypothetical protein